MITLAIIFGALLLIGFVVIPAILIGGAAIVVAFGDILIAIIVVVLIIKHVSKHNAKKNDKEP